MHFPGETPTIPESGLELEAAGRSWGVENALAIASAAPAKVSVRESFFRRFWGIPVIIGTCGESL